MISENYNTKSPRQRLVEYLSGLKDKVCKAKPNKESLCHLLCQYANFCTNLKIVNGYSGLHSLEGITFDESLKDDLINNIEMAIGVAQSRQQVESSSIQVTQTNQQGQQVNVSLIVEALRKSLTGEQYDEIMKLLNNKADKKTIKEKILSLGEDVAAGVLSALLSTLIL